MKWLWVKFILGDDRSSVPENFILDHKKLELEENSMGWAFWSPNEGDTPDKFKAREKRNPQKIEAVKGKEFPGYYKVLILIIRDSLETLKDIVDGHRIAGPVVTTSNKKKSSRSTSGRASTGKRAAQRDSITQGLKDLQTPEVSSLDMCIQKGMPRSSSIAQSTPKPARCCLDRQDNNAMMLKIIDLQDELLKRQNEIVQLTKENAELRVAAKGSNAQQFLMEVGPGSTLLSPVTERRSLMSSTPQASSVNFLDQIPVSIIGSPSTLANGTDSFPDDIRENYVEEVEDAENGPQEVPIVQSVVRPDQGGSEQIILTDEVCQNLMSEHKGAKGDSMFVRDMLEKLYPNQLSTLANRSNSGTASPRFPGASAKPPITPYKAEQVAKWYKLKVESENPTPEDLKKRLAKRTEHIRNKIKTCRPK